MTTPKKKPAPKRARAKKPAAKTRTVTVKKTATAAKVGRKTYQRNPVGREREAAQAVALYEAFAGMAAESYRRIDLPNLSALVEIGQVEAIAYRAKRAGVLGRYLHEFGKHKPTLLITPDGKCALLIEGQFEFTERGFEG